MRHREVSYKTGQMSDGSDAENHVRVEWVERFMGRDYVVKTQVDPARHADGHLLLGRGPTAEEALRVIATQDVAAAYLVGDQDRVVALRAAWGGATTTNARLDLIGKALGLNS